ncbi:CG6693 [Drosophila busckii]|uniref:CG6693 n=1 Tax=Drosophila busckii TaxID=30019 RepID=A0A0M4EKR4_DROBS|nr:J domain-containing protein CG6693 [Drosophila busckii]ALC45740.1 CG6693 [Drosophila busckii]
MSTLELCEKYFETRDVYKILGLAKDAEEKEIKKAYHKLSLLVHPDRVPEAQKEESTEKFKVLSKIYQVLTDNQKRALYDEQGVLDDDDEMSSDKLNTWLELWSKIFKPISEEDISNYEKEYVGSELERTDLKKAYLGGKGCINHIMSHVPFMGVEDEPRFKEMISKMIAAGEVPEYKIFTEEPAAKRNKRHKKYAREERESKVIKERIERRREKDDEAAESSANLEELILSRRCNRESNYNSLMDRLLKKYGGDSDDNSPTVDFSSFDKKKKLKKKKQEKKEKINSVKSGRINKSRS